MSIFKKMKLAYKDTKKSVLVVYLLLRFLVILVLIRQIFLKNYDNVFLCFFTLILFLLPFVLSKKLNIELPSLLEIIILLFIYSAEVLGEIQNFYNTFSHWDTILHTINGFLCAGVGLALTDLLNNNSKNIKLSPIYVVLVSFCFSMTIGVLWEFFEFASDRYFFTDMQKDRIVNKISTVELNPDGLNKAIIVDGIKKTEIYIDSDTITIDGGYLDIGIIDTMKDLIVNFVGAVAFSIIGYLYIKNRDKYKFTENFILKRKDLHAENN